MKKIIVDLRTDINLFNAILPFTVPLKRDGKIIGEITINESGIGTATVSDSVNLSEIFEDISINIKYKQP